MAINPNRFTTRPEIEGTFGVVTSTHWIATAVGMSMLERGGNAFDAAVATAFTLQVVEPHLNGPGGDVPVIVYDTSQRQGRGDLRAGAGARGGHHRALPQARARPRSRHRAPGRLRARHVRDLDDAVARLRHDAGLRRAGAGDLLCRARSSAGRARELHHRDGRRSVPHALADLRGGLHAGRRRTGAGRAVRQQDAGRDLQRGSCARRRAPVATATSRSRRRGVPGAEGFVAEAIDRFCRTQEIMDTSAASATAACSPATTWPVGGAHRGAAHLRLRPLHRLQGRRLVAGPGDAAAACAAQGLRSRRRRSDQRGVHPHRGRMLQARVCRPREILRRSGVRRDADRDPPVRRL